MASPVAALSCAIAAYRAAPYVYGIGTRRLTPGEQGMLNRLRESKETALALAEWDLPDGKRPVFLADCLEAHRSLNGGHSKKVEARRALPDPDKARRDLTKVADFFRKSGVCLRIDPKALRNRTQICLGSDPDVLSEAIALLASQIDRTEDTNKSSRPTLSRKGKASARLSAVGVLKASIHRLSGSPNLKAVEDIAGVVLGITITADDVKNARTPSEWFGYWGVHKSPAKVSIRQSTSGAK